jgi:hypothetical protein
MKICMKARRIRLSIEDANGGKYTIIAEGSFQRETLLSILASLEGSRQDETPATPKLDLLRKDTVQARVARLIEERFNLGSFTSSDLKEAFEERYQQPISLSAAATYLSRLASRGLLQRQRNGPSWLYRLAKGRHYLSVEK